MQELETKGVTVQRERDGLRLFGPDLHEFRAPASVVETQAKKLGFSTMRHENELIVNDASSGIVIDESAGNVARLTLKDGLVTSAVCLISENGVLGETRRKRLFKLLLWSTLPKQLKLAQLIQKENLAVKLREGNVEVSALEMKRLFPSQQSETQEFIVTGSKTRQRGGQNDSHVLVTLEDGKAVRATVPVSNLSREHAEHIAQILGEALRNGHSLDQLRKAFGKTRQIS